ncbi:MULTISPECIES: helix-turn-helix domain-containing protein [unclassified Streptomyces]|uniref:helix-turn-helix domain-containing protein n=1 Tax=unclassified Streptomyces TaxID=2593676 RepID=UPI0004CADA32|nr:helix-turn-helix transcriptional regulator [Streptomyces sp. NRRL F-5630]
MAREESDGSGNQNWDSDEEVEDEEDSAAVLEAVGRQIKLWRQSAGLSQPAFGAAIGYSEAQVYKVEAGKRIPKPDFLDKADEILDAGGKLAEFKRDVAEARYPKKLRHLTKLERESLEILVYGAHNIPGLLQSKEYATAMFAQARPALLRERFERLVEARLARQAVFDRRPMVTLSFVLEEVTLRRPIGGRAVLRGELEHLLAVSERPNVELQVMPTDSEEHAGLGGALQVLRLENGKTVGYSEAQLTSRIISDPREVHALEVRYGILRSQALGPARSREFIEKLLGDT